MNSKKKINYGCSLISFQCVRKHLLSDQIYELNLLPDCLIIGKGKEDQDPKYFLLMDIQNTIDWLVKKDFKPFAFAILYRGQKKEFQASSDNLLKLKQLIGKQMTFSTIKDFYNPLRVLGQGCTAQVFEGQDRLSSDKYAIKCISKKDLADDNQKLGEFAGFYQELECMKDLNHPNIISLKEVYEGEQTFYMVLELLSGISLHEYFSQQQANIISKADVKLIIRQILEGLAFMHSQNIMHRDLKPENIMFKEVGSIKELKIVDFGLATKTSAEEFLYPKCGTPGYVAPEVANLENLKKKYDKICDLFSVGCIMFKLLTLHDLFPGNDHKQVFLLNKKCQIDYKIMPMYSVDNDTISLLKRLLDPNPNTRIPAKEALNHPFFQENSSTANSSSEKKTNFQTAKLQKEQVKPLWNTTNFDSSVQMMQVQHSRFEGRGLANIIRDIDIDDIGEEVQGKQAIPTLKVQDFKKNFVMKTDLKNGGKKKAFKKFETAEFNSFDSDVQQARPTFVFEMNSFEFKEKSQSPQKFQKYQIDQQQQIQEAQDEDV